MLYSMAAMCCMIKILQKSTIAGLGLWQNSGDRRGRGDVSLPMRRLIPPLLLACFLAGCGYKGSLILPDQEPVQKESVSSPSSTG